MDFEEAVAARRTIRSFEGRPVPRAIVDRALSLAVQAPAPHHSAPWRFLLIEDDGEKERFSAAMAGAWRADLAGDGFTEDRVARILQKSHRMLTSAPLLVVCCADMSRADDYRDERRRRAEWSLFAHAVGGALQTFMLALAEDSVASCWISAPVFCGDVVRSHFGLDPVIEPHALVLVGYPDRDYQPRPRPTPDLTRFVLRP